MQSRGERDALSALGALSRPQTPSDALRRPQTMSLACNQVFDEARGEGRERCDEHLHAAQGIVSGNQRTLAKRADEEIDEEQSVAISGNQRTLAKRAMRRLRRSSTTITPKSAIKTLIRKVGRGEVGGGGEGKVEGGGR